MVIPSAWLSVFGKWLPIDVLQEIVPFLEKDWLGTVSAFSRPNPKEGITIVHPPPLPLKVTPRKFKELIRTIWGLIRPNRVPNLGGVLV